MWRSVEDDLRVEECVYCGHKYPFVSEYMQGEYVKYKCMMCQKIFEKPGVDESAFKSVEWNENDKKFYYKTATGGGQLNQDQLDHNARVNALLAEEENIPLTEAEIAASREWVASEILAGVKYQNDKIKKRARIRWAILTAITVLILLTIIWSAYK